MPNRKETFSHDLGVTGIDMEIEMKRLSVVLLLMSAQTVMAQVAPGCGCGRRAPVVPVLPAPVMPAPAAACCPVPVVRTVPRPVYSTVMRPVVETQYRQQQITTMRPVTKTEVRREAVTVNVPVTTTRQVTVDEGSYQMVWVPKKVTKNIQETHVQQQVRYRDVPYQVTQHVPETHTQLVPQRTVRYVPETRQTGVACQPVMTGTAMLPAFPVASAPIVSGTALAPIAEPAQTAQAPQGEWQKVPQRADNSDVELQSYEQPATAGSADAAPAAAPRRIFSSAPTAAAVWRSTQR